MRRTRRAAVPRLGTDAEDRAVWNGDAAPGHLQLAAGDAVGSPRAEGAAALL